MKKIKIIAEIGINHNGSVELAKKIIAVSAAAGCDYVKFQKRNPDVCVPEDQKLKVRSTPWGEMTYIDYKKKIEFEKEQYDEIDKFCKQLGIKWFASAWDLSSLDFLKRYSDVVKIPSALITNEELLLNARKKFDFLLISTGMSTESEVENAVKISNPDVIFHTNSSYPSKVEDLNLNYIKHLKNKFNRTVGYSGHEFGLVTTFATVPLGVEWIERHVTLDREMWGSDQKSSVEPSGIYKLVKGIRDIEKSLGSIGPRVICKEELEKKKSLRG
jgi:N-acetylneuraminate synthase